MGGCADFKVFGAGDACTGCGRGLGNLEKFKRRTIYAIHLAIGLPVDRLRCFITEELSNAFDLRIYTRGCTVGRAGACGGNHRFPRRKTEKSLGESVNMNELQARVLAQNKGIYIISNGTDVKPASVSGKYRYTAATIADYPTVGDYVAVQWPADGSNAVITRLLPRKSCFIRKAAGPEKREQLVAANIDIAFICMSLNHNFNVRRLERYLSITFDSGATPVVVLTKSDLCPDVARKIAKTQNAAPGVDILAVSSLDGDYEAVAKYIQPGQTVAFIGSSGVGKSTLINKLTGNDRIATQATGQNDKGRHTTTHRELISLPNGAFVIDTPGMRELGLWDSGDGIDTAFVDIESLARECKFSNCTHTSEPGCAIQSALADGTLDAARLASYRKLKAENEYAAEHSKYLEAKRAKFRAIAKINASNRKKKR